MKLSYLGLSWLPLLLAAAQVHAGASILPFRKADPAPAHDVPLQELEPADRARVKPLLERPTMKAKGPVENFVCQPGHYLWFLEHPDKAVHAWRRVGAKCVSIEPRGEGRFGWSDDQGSDVTWYTVHRGSGLRVWYAEGKVRPGPALPLVPVKAVVVLRHSVAKAADRPTVVQHSSDLYVQTDSKVAATLTKLLGAQAPRVAEQGLGQLQLFFAGISWYLNRHPDRAEAILQAAAAQKE